jgi:hypothetical protein
LSCMHSGKGKVEECLWQRGKMKLRRQNERRGAH